MDEDVMESTQVDSPGSSVEVQEEPAEGSYTVKVDGSEEQVSLDELRDGYQRQSDYTRKTQELASERKNGYNRPRRLCRRWSQIQRGPFRLWEMRLAYKRPGGPRQQDRVPYGSGWEDDVEPEDATTKRITELEAQARPSGPFAKTTTSREAGRRLTGSSTETSTLRNCSNMR